MSQKIKIVLLTFTLALIWGHSYLFMKVAVAEIPPVTMLLARVLVASTLLFFYLKYKKVEIPRGFKTWARFSVMGLLGSAIPFTTIAWATIYIDSSLAGIVNGGVTPIATAVLAHFLVAGERLSTSRTIGIALGLSGFLCVLLPRINDGVDHNAFGILLITLASFSYAFSLLFAKRNLTGFNPLLLPFGQLLTSSFILLPASIILDYPQTVISIFSSASLTSIGAVAGLTIFGTFIAFILYFRVLHLGGPTQATMALYLSPGISIILGILILGEKIPLLTWLGFALSILGVLIVNEVITWKGQAVEEALDKTQQ